MHRLLAPLAVAALVMPAGTADAQVYPERIRSVTRTAASLRAERFQRDRVTETERTTRTVRLGPEGDLEISNISGDITITRGGGNEAVIEIIKTGRARTSEEAKAALQAVTVDIAERGGRVEIKTRYPQSDERRERWRNINVDTTFNITAPERTRVSVNSVSGSVSVKDLKGDLSLETISGDVRVANAGRVSKASTVSGNVEIVDTTVEGMMEAATISGTLLVRNVKARQLDLGTVSGDVVIEAVNAERVDGQSVSGGIRLTGPLTRGARYDLGSHSGEVRVVVAGDVGFEIEASSFSGSIRSDVDLKLAGTSSGRRSQRSIRGTFGDGSAFLDLTTFSGSVVISRK